MEKAIFQENNLKYEDYYRLRERVGWKNFSRTQAEKSLNHSVYSVTAILNHQVVAMGRLVGDGMYYMIVDVVVQPEYQKMGLGSKIIRQMVDYVEQETPLGGRSSLQLIAEKGKEIFYEKMGFKQIPHNFCGSGMRRVVYK